jgi:ABC-type lipoprotein release transport system permease subunit
MKLIMTIAWRNIMRHRGKSLVIGVILFMGALLMTVGNGVISGMDKGLQEHIVNGFTGDLVVVSDKQQSDNVFIDMMGKAIEPVHNFKQIDSVLKKIDYIKNYLPIGKNMAMVLNEEGGAPGFIYVLGVDFDRYKKMFPGNLSAIEGRLLENGERGALLPTGARKEMFDLTNLWFSCEQCPLDTAKLDPEVKAVLSSVVFKDSVVYMGMSLDNNTSTDIRLGIKGITRYNALNRIWGHFTMVDIESYRQALGYFTSEARLVLSDKEKQFLELEEEDLDAMFTDDMAAATADPAPVSVIEQTTPGPFSDAAPTDLDAGTYNMVLVLLKDHGNLDRILPDLNKTLKEKQLGVRAVSWKKATGMIGSMTVIIKGSLFVFVMFLFLVAIIVIVNTLSMAALERTPEIGMMRAIGARKSFISRMFIGETATLSFFFGGLGILTGFVIINIVSLFDIKSSNDMVQLLFGGDTFNPFLSAGDIAVVVVQLAIVTVIAMIYPMSIARKITPLDAISRE